MNKPTVLAELDSVTGDVPVFNGVLFGCYHVPVEIKGIGKRELAKPVWLAPGETLEFWLVINRQREWYETRLHPVGCSCGGKCKT